MPGIEAKDFASPDESVTFDHGRVDLVNIGALPIGREVLEPGFRWSTHVQPIVGTDWCEFHHVTYLLSGRFHIAMRDGESRELTAGQAMDVAPGHDAWVVGNEPVVLIDFHGFVGWAKAPEPGERVLSTILFTDIVDSTAAAERLGDKAWERLLAAHHEDARSLLGLHRGREVKMTGDGFLMTFEAPARAIAYALAMTSAAKKLGLEIRAGIHTGEVEVSSGDLRGLAVHLAARIMAVAEPSSVFVSETCRELASGSTVEFVDRGRHAFKGISGERLVFEARVRGSVVPA
jgi:class 3 adenylate cyclase